MLKGLLSGAASDNNMELSMSSYVKKNMVLSTTTKMNNNHFIFIFICIFIHVNLFCLAV